MIPGPEGNQRKKCRICSNRSMHKNMWRFPDIKACVCKRCWKEYGPIPIVDRKEYLDKAMKTHRRMRAQKAIERMLEEG